MDDGNKEDWEDQDGRNESKARCDKHKGENTTSETEMGKGRIRRLLFAGKKVKKKVKVVFI